MANKITDTIGPSYFSQFAAAQGLTIADYVAYSANLDTSLQTLASTINTMIDEIKGFQGQNVLLGLDLMVMDAFDRAQGAERDGLVGAASYANTISTNTLTVEPGVALVNSGLRVEQTTQAVLTASGAAGPRFLAIDANGAPTLETSDTAGILNLYQFDFDVGTPNELDNKRRLANIMNDGDDYEFERKRIGTGVRSSPALSLTFTTTTIFRDSGVWTDDGFADLDSITITGSNDNDADVTIASGASTATLVITETLTVEGPASGIILSTGAFRFHDFDSAHERLEDIENIMAGIAGVSGNMVVFPDGTLALPGIAFASDLSNGFSLGGGALNVSINEIQVAQFVAFGVRVGGGTAALPSFAFTGSTTTGFFSPGTNQLGLATSATAALTIDASQQVTVPLQAAGYVSLATQTITTGAGQVIAFDTELFDRQNQHSSGVVTIANVGQAGLYEINIEGRVDEAAGGTTAAPMTLQIRDGSTVRATAFIDGVGSGGTNARIQGFNASVLLQLDNADTFDVFATQGSVSSSVAFTDLRLSWSKVA